MQCTGTKCTTLKIKDPRQCLCKKEKNSDVFVIFKSKRIEFKLSVCNFYILKDRYLIKPLDGDNAKRNWYALNLPRKYSTYSIAKSKCSKQTKIDNLRELLPKSNGVKSIQADENYQYCLEDLSQYLFKTPRSTTLQILHKS